MRQEASQANKHGWSYRIFHGRGKQVSKGDAIGAARCAPMARERTHSRRLRTPADHALPLLCLRNEHNNHSLFKLRQHALHTRMSNRGAVGSVRLGRSGLDLEG